MTSPEVRVAAVGCGYWGPNVIRNLDAVHGFELRWVCDVDPERLEPVAARSMKVSALLNFTITRSGTDWSAHVGLVSTTPRIQLGVVHGSVGLVVDAVGELLVVVLDDRVIVVDVAGILLLVVPGTVARRRTSPSTSAT